MTNEQRKARHAAIKKKIAEFLLQAPPMTLKQLNLEVKRIVSSRPGA